MALRQQLRLDGERHFGRSWPINESGQLVRNPSNHQLGHSAGFNVSEIHKQQQRLVAQDEQLNFLGRNHLEQNHRGFYDPSSMIFERSSPVYVQGRELLEHRPYPLDVIRRRMQMTGWHNAAYVVTGDGRGKAPLEYARMIDSFRRTVRQGIRRQYFVSLKLPRTKNSASLEASDIAFADIQHELPIPNISSSATLEAQVHTMEFM
ncbi:hypothetical protein KIW84_012981 [Lathyrus oleraceus]|uniref:Uncharacterized protein n=1 Tax=Pisum sativum TaxID=3888 RepID=A0A9D5BIZ0_PEA|nr:hypothetical protein KIW84_012981 [Pisum sativum]